MNAHPAVRFLVPIVIAAVLGPLIPAVVLCVWALASDFSDLFSGAGSGPASDLIGLFVFYIIFAYLIGAPIAVLAGLLVSLWMIWRPPNTLVVNAAAVLATVLFMGVAALGLLGPVQETNGRSNLVFTLVMAVIAANVCWLLTRRFVPAVVPSTA